jgi:hypothetical protein
MGRAADAERTMLNLTRREPESFVDWLWWTRMELARGQVAAARLLFARARQLDSQIPPGILPQPFSLTPPRL